MALLSIDGLTVAYDKVEAVRGVSLAIEAGQIVTVIGPNGAGKTTLLSAAMGLLRGHGRMSFDGMDLRRLDVEARVEHGFCLVPERRELFGDMTVADNLLLGGYSRRRDTAARGASIAPARCLSRRRLREARSMQESGTPLGRAASLIPDRAEALRLQRVILDRLRLRQVTLHLCNRLIQRVLEVG